MRWSDRLETAQRKQEKVRPNKLAKTCVTRQGIWESAEDFANFMKDIFKNSK